MSRRAWAWLLVAVVWLQGAVPLLATTAARHQGVSLVEICSIYGVQTVDLASDHGAPDESPSPLSGHHASGWGCALTSVLAGAGVPVSWPAVWLHAPPVDVSAQPALGPVRVVDATRRWLAARLHAPPLSV